ncbi:MAG TPA: OsmC family protein [Frankiaceae bacterium]|nr:OsmC family protein [Frankiaceae bacterium]
MTGVAVRHLGGDAFAVTIRGHELVVDQPVEDGGTDTGPTPTELFAASLASCVAFYAGRFLRRHDVAPDGLGVRCAFRMAEGHPARVAGIDLTVDVPEAFPAERAEALRRVVERCTVQNTLREPPDVRLEIALR